MTEYGRGQGSEPWHPEDPLYGDQGWGAQQAASGQALYAGQDEQYQQQPQQPYYPQQTQDPYGQQQYAQAQQQQQQQQYAQAQQQQQQQQYAEAQQQQYQQGYAEQLHQGYPQQQYPDQYAAQPQQPQQFSGGWDTTGEQAAMPYAGQQPDPYHNGYAGEGHDPYGTPEAYPPPQPPGQRQAPVVPEVPEQGHEWDAEPQEERHPFFTGVDDSERGDDDPAETRGADGGGGGRERRSKTKKKGKSGRACLVLAVIFAIGAGGVGYVGYDFYQKKFGAAPDYVGEGSGDTVTIEVPAGAGGSEIGSLLKQAGVVKSIDAFVQAQNDNPKGKTIQAGAYTMKKGMSAANAIQLMLNPASRNALIIPEGKRNAWVYEQIDKRLGVTAGTTKDVAAKNVNSMGLPDWAKGHKDVKDPLEGFLYPASYPVAKGMKPEDVLKKMVNRATSEYGKQDLAGEAKKLKLDGPWQLVTVASLVQAEGKTPDDFRKMAEVVYNRLKPDNFQTNQKLQFDSAYNYLTNQSNIKIGLSEINSNPDPYNTYKWRGLTPGPIGNPGSEAMAAALDPTNDGWLYFVATDGVHKTEFAKTLAEFNKLKEEFNAQSGQ
ncbi:endolytic transglycosylase MltG [Streptomyces sp. NBC_00083]|uniref:endolytic transglycosylase MltG n=1 Tax=Streptomyces sp. NBC_00083 TaxID=2975647 RepID=UPI00224FBA31|nr:endolytic transglycosylase MltG [Streptomyces sp. NBC_00083]MCX5383568.1 endolytic transglycosylase MltG [Streptomyces sp. NBC_00083]